MSDILVIKCRSAVRPERLGELRRDILTQKETHNINTNVESISDIEIDILEVDVNQVTDIDLGGYVE